MFDRPLRSLLIALLFATWPLIAFANGPLTNGSLVSGSVTNDGRNQSVDSWTFNAVAGDFARIGFVVTNSPKNASLCYLLLQPDGSIYGCYYGSNSYNALGQTGTYTVQVVWGSGTPSTVNYSMMLAEAGTTFQGTATTNGATATGTLSSVAAMAEYTAYIPAGVSYYATVGSTSSSPSGLGFGLQITTPNGAQILSGYYTDYNNVNFVTSVGGNYRFVIYRADSASLTAANYNFSVAVGGLPAILVGGRTIADGTYTGSIAHGVFDEWPFVAAGGQPITVSIADAPGNPSGAGIGFNVFNPSGVKLISGYTPNITFTPTASGTYRVLIYRGDSGASAYYQNALYNLTLKGSSLPAPNVALLDPVDNSSPTSSLLYGAAVTTDTNRLAVGGRLVSGIAADGTAELVLRIAASGPRETFVVSLTGDGYIGPVGSRPSGQNDIVVTATANTQSPYAYAVYRAPMNFAGESSNGASASGLITLTVTPVGSFAAAVKPVTVWRPPVVLVHGLWSSPSAWKEFVPLVSIAPDGTQAFDPRFDGYFIDYQDNASDAVSSIVSMENGALSQLADAVKSFKAKHSAAAVQADVVAHSMGGLVARDMALSPNFFWQTYGMGMIHKVVTIGTPHAGTPIAGRLLNSSILCRAALLLAGHAVAGAVTDLQPNSALISSLSSSTVPLQAHALAGDASTAQEVVSAVALDAVGFFVSKETDTNVCFGILPLGGYQALYGGDSDLLVPLPSQTYGFGSQFQDVYSGTEHTIIPVLFPLGPDELNRDSTFSLGFITAPGTSLIPNRVIDLLNEPLTQGAFTSITP